MNTYILNFDNKETAESLHTYLKQMLDLPAYYGHNLDALYDCLTSFSASTNIAIANFNDDNIIHRRIFNVMKDAATTNPKLHLQHPQGEWIKK
jgi:ribonuclease inhibitor